MKARQVLTSTILPLLLTGAAHAATVTYTSTTGSWSDGTKWSGGVVPGAGSDAVINLAGSNVFYDNAANPALNSVTLDASGAGATLVQAVNTLTTATLTIGNTATGKYTLSAGSLVVTGDTATSHLIIGAGAGGNGTFDLSGTGSVTANSLHVGGGTSNPAGASSGTFVQSGGTVNVTGGTGTVIVGDTAGTSGSYTISGGSLTAKKVFVGLQGANPTTGSRSVTQSGGTVTVNDSLNLGGFFGGTSTPSGSYTLSGTEASSVLNSSKVYVGLSGNGTFNQEGGTHNINVGSGVGDHSLLIASEQAGSVGTYNMKNGVLNTDAIYIGSFSGGGQGTMNHSGGTVNVSQQLVVDSGGTASTLGKYVMSLGAILNTNATGADPGAYIAVGAEFEHKGGTFNANSAGTGLGLRNDGKFTLSGGTLQGTGDKINYGTFSGFGTVAGTGKLINEGSMKFSGGNSTISAPVENRAGHLFEVQGNVAVFDGAVKNFGDFKTTDTTVVFNGPFSNAGKFLSDPSTQTYAGGYENLQGGYLTTIEAGDLFRIGAGFTVPKGTADASLWSTETAILEFFKANGNTTGNHSLIYAGLDFGGTTNGQGFLGFQDNFSWGEVIIGAGNYLVTSGGGALYTEKLTFSTSDLTQIQAQVAQFSGNMKIYYDPADNPQLQGRKFDFGSGGGSVSPVPEPATILLLGVGAIGLGFRRRRA